MTKQIISFLWVALAAVLTGVAPPQDRVSFAEAKKTALKLCDGTVKSSGLEQVDSVWIYTFEIQTKKKKSCMISIDALTGVMRTKEVSSNTE